MSLVVQNRQLLSDLNALTASWYGVRKIGLFGNDWQPRHNSTIAEVQPCTWAGYSGLHDLVGWSAAALVGDIAVTFATPRLWIYSGGPPSGWTVGYYVVDAGGQLCWAERLPGEPVAMVVTGQQIAFTPAFALRSRYS